jgi:hypothetical protein
MPKKASAKELNPVIVVAVITLIGTVVSAVLSSPVLVAKLQSSSGSTQLPISNTDAYPALPQTGDSTLQVEDVLVYSQQWQHSSDFDPIKSVILLEDNINPTIHPEESLDEILKNVENKQIRYWSQVSSALILTLNMQNIQSENGLDIKIEKEASVEINSYQSISSHVNALVEPNASEFIPISGGVTNYHFEPVILEALNVGNKAVTTNLMEYDAVILKPGEIGTFDFLLTCKSSGIYVLAVVLQTFYRGESKEIELPSPVPLVCPESLTIWDYQNFTGNTIRYEWMQLGDFVLQGGQYESADNTIATPEQ